jgi:hypothetical protein
MFHVRLLRAALAPLLALGVVAVATPAQAATFTATADTFVNGGSPTASFGTQTTMRADDGFPKIAYLRFPAPAVQEVTLRLYGAGAQDPVSFDVHLVAVNSWSETTTYNTRPSTGSYVTSGTVVANGYTEVDFIVSTLHTVELAIVRTSAGPDSIFATRESANPPQLVERGSTTPPPPPPPAVCADGLDNDDDGATDFPADPGCTSSTDTDETNPVTPPPPPPPPPSGGFDVLGVTQAYIDGLPTTGAEWAELVAMADAPYTVDSGDGAVDGSGNAVAGALVYARTGNTGYKTKVEAALTTVQGIAPGAWQHAAFNRKFGGWVAAAQLIGKPARNADGSLNAWGSLVNSHLTTLHSGGPARSNDVMDAARGWDNNHGAAARQTVAAIEAYLDLPLTASCNAMKAWLGGTHPAYAFVPSTNPGPNQMGWTGSAANSGWYVTSPYLAGINPPVADLRLNGAIPSDVERDGGNFPTIGAAGADHYVDGNMMRETAAMVTLTANGCPLWTHGTSALDRADDWATRYIPDHQNDYLGNADPVMNAVYGNATPADVGTGENFLVASEWLTLGGAWPIR